MEKLERSSVVERVIHSLTEAIVSGEIGPGDRIPTESELVENLGVARNSIREAIKILCYLGVLEIRRADGTYVCDGFTGQMLNPLLYGVLLGRQNMEELSELRAILESGLARLAAENMSEWDMEPLRDLCAQLRGAALAEQTEAEKVDRIYQSLHDAIGQLSGNGMAGRIEGYIRKITTVPRQKALEDLLAEGRGEAFCQPQERLLELKQIRTEDLYRVVRETFVGGL